ncbi:uncharacterized protein PHACADRAFT_259693 [Phanerochaete carnosa HHB-10118-sp]|uniref:Serine hydrolase domain-containing protein n=1 Tax=Phanerochaete carnosa (strain HHB-10118-sp) TaxID=650164 RepID=K5VPK3_PHACS|nr:uncharacterized protein PHACADRAFT_259693 [Phanerochaete carnosa HHB-10118-sp]EKM53368.1 hypothetical protein PHACADRAFT_259693 [Phanerochaete carnosa HHB-10118-sp]
MTTRKVLVLHGYAQSAAIFSKRLGALRKTCKGVDLVFLDAPHVLSPVDLAESFNAPEELGTSETAESDPALQPRGWWRSRTNLVGIEDSLVLLRDTLRKDHYDGVFGFSQGAALAAMLAALLEKPHVVPYFLVDGKAPHEPLEFCIVAAGFRPRGELGDAIFLPSYSTQTLHILGRNDVIVVEERSKTLLDVSANKRVEWHDGGHFVPSKANWRNFLRDYMNDPGIHIPSPGGAAISQPASGAATPAEPSY